MNRFRFVVLLAVMAIVTSPLRAEIIEMEGVAAIKAVGIERARQIAIQDAKEQEIMQSGVQVEMASSVGQKGIHLESSRMRSAATIGKITVVREWQTGDYLHVLISANVDRSGNMSTLTQKYKKKISATPFVIRKYYGTDDIDDIARGFSNELLRRLENGNRFLTKESKYVISASSSGPTQDKEAVMHIATLYDSQFVIAGEIVDASISDDAVYYGFFQHKKRRFEVDIFVYDGLTGSLIARHRIDKFAIGDVAIGRDKPFASQAFLSTNFGLAISAAIDSAAELIVKDLEGLPFTAKVIKITDGKLYIDAGGTSFVAPGDKLVAYHLRRELPVMGFGPGSEYGVTETPVATASIVQVQPMFSICVLPPLDKGAMIEVGDLVRFDSESQTRN